MASLHRASRGKSPFWQAAFTLPDGRRVLRSTKETNRAKAAEIARGWEKAAKLGRAGTLTEVQARRVVDDILENVGQGRVNVQSVEEFFAGWLASKQTSKAKGTARRYQDVLTPFLAHLGPAKRKAPLAGLTPRDVESFRDGELKAGLANGTANFSLKVVRTVLNAARRQGLVLTNAAEAVETLPANTAERGTLTAGELRTLLASVNDEWRGVILLGYTAGLRLGDAARLRWGNVELAGTAGPLLRFHPQKTSRAGAKRKPLEVPIVPDLEAYLLALPTRDGQPDAPLFPKLSRKTVEGRIGLSNTFTAMLAAAGINNEALSEGKGTKGRTVWRLSFHSLRHTFISQLANAGVSKELRMKLAGHTSAAHDRYTHLEAETLRAAMRGVSSVL